MRRLLSAVLVVAGLLIFLGNLSGTFPTVPGLGIALIVGGVVLAYYIHRIDALAAGVEDWQ